LHINDFNALLAAWQAATNEVRRRMALRRPLLRALTMQPQPDRLMLERLFLLERLIWERVNAQRHSRYARPWRLFYRAWRKEPDWIWPTSENFP